MCIKMYIMVRALCISMFLWGNIKALRNVLSIVSPPPHRKVCSLRFGLITINVVMLIRITLSMLGQSKAISDIDDLVQDCSNSTANTLRTVVFLYAFCLYCIMFFLIPCDMMMVNTLNSRKAIKIFWIWYPIMPHWKDGPGLGIHLLVLLL